MVASQFPPLCSDSVSNQGLPLFKFQLHLLGGSLETLVVDQPGFHLVMLHNDASQRFRTHVPTPCHADETTYRKNSLSCRTRCSYGAHTPPNTRQNCEFPLILAPTFCRVLFLCIFIRTQTKTRGASQKVNPGPRPRRGRDPGFSF